MCFGRNVVMEKGAGKRKNVVKNQTKAQRQCIKVYNVFLDELQLLKSWKIA